MLKTRLYDKFMTKSRDKMKNKIIKYFKEIVLFFIVITIFANILSFYRSTELLKKPLDLFSISTINDNIISSDKKPVLIHFWATWCPICKVEASNIQTISESFNVITVAVKSGDDNEIDKYLNKNSFNFKVINDLDGLIASKYRVSIFPTTIIYDNDGNEVFSEVGYTSTLGLWLRMLWASY